MVNKKAATLIGAAVALVIMASTAGAHLSGPISGMPAFTTACNGVGGVVEGNGSGATCTWTTVGQLAIVKSREVPGEGDWYVEVSQSITHVATWWNANADGVTNVDTPGPAVVTRCWNPGGQEMDISHQHCQLP